MKFGVREICDVVFKAKDYMVVGDKEFYANEPVIYFDSLKTSTLEGSVTTVYAQGGKGNSRLIGWDGEKTVTFTMEDALISPVGLMILSGAGLVSATDGKPVIQHVTEIVEVGADRVIKVKEKPYIPEGNTTEDYIYVMGVDNKNEPSSEPYIYTYTETEGEKDEYTLTMSDRTDYTTTALPTTITKVLVDYYVARTSDAQQIDIGPESFGGNFYIEASTLFRNENGKDLPAEFIIPNAKVQSNFTFTMASTGDPSTFTFTLDAFPDTTRFNSTKRVFAALQIIGDTTGSAETVTTRKATPAN